MARELSTLKTSDNNFEVYDLVEVHCALETGAEKHWWVQIRRMRFTTAIFQLIMLISSCRYPGEVVRKFSIYGSLNYEVLLDAKAQVNTRHTCNDA